MQAYLNFPIYLQAAKFVIQIVIYYGGGNNLYGVNTVGYFGHHGTHVSILNHSYEAGFSVG